MNNYKKDLLLICNKFPYGFGEVFLEAEFPFLYKSFRRITIVTNTNSHQLTRDIPQDVRVIRKQRKKSYSEILKTIWYIIIYLKTFIRIIYEEKKSHHHIIKQYHEIKHTNSFHILVPIIDNAFKAFNLKMFLKKNVLNRINNNAVLYSYWQDYAALALALIKNESSSFTAICRAHRVDLYFDASKYNYLTFRPYISESLDKIIFISEDGLKYQSKVLNKKYSNYVVSRLGTHKIDESSYKKRSNKFVLVSCSTLTPVKRVHLIIDALSMITDKEIEWIHFGDGKLKKKLILQAQKKLDDKPNITYTFKGNVSNKEIHKFYANNDVSYFINVSESEGIPVSIMEAMSYGIPVIATNVGGTQEIVDNQCGLLLNSDIDIQSLVYQINSELRVNEVKTKRNNAKKKWQRNFNAYKNYTNFIQDLYA